MPGLTDPSLVLGAALVAAIGWWFVRPMFGRIAPAEARKLVEGGAKLVDVRTPREFASGHVEGAENIPLADIRSAAARLAQDGGPCVLYCASGVRSASAARLLRKAGVTAYDLGPMSRWG